MPYPQIILFISNDMVVKGTLPHMFTTAYLSNLLCHNHFILSDYSGQVFPFFPRCFCRHNHNRMNIVGHHNIFIDCDCRIYLWYLYQKFLSNPSKRIQMSDFSENTLLVMGTYGDKVVVRGSIIVTGNAGAFLVFLFHNPTSFRPAWLSKAVGGAMPLPYSILISVFSTLQPPFRRSGCFWGYRRGL